MSPHALPEGSLLLHIGPPKTGSTAIQMALHTSRAELAEHGVLYPGTRVRDRPASWAVLGSRSAVGREEPRVERWHALVDEIRRTDLPRVCLSHENFARADDAAVQRILDGTGRDRTHVVYVARRLDKLLPSHWQERVKAWETAPYETYLHRMLDEPSAKGGIWQPHDVESVIARWAARVGHDRITVVCSDERDRGLILRTFDSMLGLPDGFLIAPPDRTNASLSFTEAEALRGLNQMAKEHQWTPREYWLVMQEGVLRALPPRDRTADVRISGLPPWAHERVIERAERQVAAILSSGVRVIGDPASLRLGRTSGSVDLPSPVDTIPLDLVVDLVRGAVEGARTMHRRDLRAQASPDRGDRPRAPRQLRSYLGRLLRSVGSRGR